MHGDMAQGSRTETLAAFKNGEITLLVATDVAGRGLDVVGLSHVFNFDVPIHAEDYVHRIGRTGRAGREGRAFTLATPDDHKFVGAITRLIGKQIPPFEVPGAPVIDEAAEAAEAPKGRRGARGGAERGGDRKRGGQARDRSRSEAPREHAEPQREPEQVAPLAAEAPVQPAHSEREERPRRERPAEKAFQDKRRDRPARGERDKSARPERDKSARPERDQSARPERDRTARPERRDRNDRDDRPVLSFGDHVPTFMQRPIRKESEQA
jgi:superfamily II DNA/RNA helicase